MKSPSDYASHGPIAWPHGLHLAGIVDFWNRVDFGRKLFTLSQRVEKLEESNKETGE